MNGKYVQELFPAFLEIKDQDLRFKAVEAMKMAMEQGGWNEDNIRLCPVTLNWKECDVTWVEHVTDVTKVCMLQHEEMKIYYERHGVCFDRDVMIAGALLHDIGKLTEFCLEEGRPAHRAGCELMRHPLSGALIAAKAGLPDKVVHLIATHSFEGDKSYQTAESEFVRAIDLQVFRCSLQGLVKAD